MNPRPNASPMASTGYQAPGPGPFVLPRLTDGEGDAEESTRAVSREQMMRSQDAHVVVGEDAMGDEATLAVPAGHVDGLDPKIAAALLETMTERESSQPQLDPAPAFPAPPQHFQQQNPMSSGRQQAVSPYGQAPQPLGMGMQHVAPSWGSDAGQSARNQAQQAFDPMLPQYGSQSGQGHMPGQFSGQVSAGQPMQQMPPMGMQQQQHGAPGGYGQHPNAPMGAGAQPYAMQPMQGQPPGWGPQPAPPRAGANPLAKLTPQVILLVAVGVVCLAIFVIGIVLFVTTKF